MVVNEDGTPKVVYHGTNTNDIEVFDNETGAYWFSDSYDYAEAMAEERGGKTVLQMYLNMSTKKCTSPNGFCPVCLLLDAMNKIVVIVSLVFFLVVLLLDIYYFFFAKKLYQQYENQIHE